MRVSVYPNICAECARENITQQCLADRLNVSLRTLNNWLSGRTPIPSHAVLAMAQMWNVTTDYILNMSS